MLIIAEIVRYNQPGIYEGLISMIDECIVGIGYTPPDEDELPEFKEMKYLMEERRGVVL